MDSFIDERQKNVERRNRFLDVPFMVKDNQLLDGFSDNPFMIGYDNRIYEVDKELGFRFPKGKLVSSKKFVSLENAIKKLKERTGYLTILNIGDSSTSGWDSNKVFKGNKDPNAPFFNYKTYSDLFEEQLSVNVINAGVPGYTSYQGRKYLEMLLRRISKEGVRVDYVTIYFGNNDCTYNQHEDKVRLDGKMASQNNKGERVTIEDYKRNLKYMIEIIREYGAKPILIVPPIHYDWEPGIRADKYREESLKVLRELKNSQLTKELQVARAFYEKKEYVQACENDRVLPRLKQRYRKALLQVARETKTYEIDVQNQIPIINNSEYFVDYCHPLEKVNQMITDKFQHIRNSELFNTSLKDKIYGLFKGLTKKKEKTSGGPSPDIYAMS